MGTGYSYLVFGAAALLAWRFHRSRVVAAILALAVAERVLRLEVDAIAPTVHAATAFILPLILGFLALARDRGVLGFRGFVQLAAVLAVAGAAALALTSEPKLTSSLFRHRLVKLDLLGWLGVPQPALLAQVAGLATSLAVVIRRPRVVERGFMWAIVASFFAVRALQGSAEASLFFMAAGLILLLAVVESSYSMAYHDELTGLPARRAFRDTLAELGDRYSIAMVDVDRFKKFNDRHGHDVGDQVLRLVASRLRQVSGGGRAFRYGGEEFAIIFPGRMRDEVVPHLETLRGEIESYSFTLRGRRRPRHKPEKGKTKGSRRGGKKLAVTVSIGVAQRSGRNPTTEKVLKAADRALYRAKRTGRNRVST